MSTPIYSSANGYIGENFFTLHFDAALDAVSPPQIYVMPELIGGGRPLFPSTGFQASPRLLSAQALDRGCVRLHYALTAAGPG